MVHGRLEFEMAADAEAVFDAFHHLQWRRRWDSLVGDSRVEGGADCPSVGAITVNQGRGWLQGVSMRTRFVSFDRPRVAAAVMLGRSFPFTQWAASMRHRALGPGCSLMIYTYRLEVGPAWARRLVEPLVAALFQRQTRRRFARLQAFVAAHASQLQAWQRDRAGGAP